MAFRKFVKSRYFPNVSFHHFGEIKSNVVSSGECSEFHSLVFEDPGVLSKQCLPLTSLDAVIRSGETIDGSISFRRSDPALVESDVNSVVSSYVQNYVSNSNNSNKSLNNEN